MHVKMIVGRKSYYLREDVFLSCNPKNVLYVADFVEDRGHAIKDRFGDNVPPEHYTQGVDSIDVSEIREVVKDQGRQHLEKIIQMYAL